MVRFSNIRVRQGVIGALNIGHLQVIDVAISHIQHNGDLALSHALWEFTQAVLDGQEVEPAARKEMIEQLAFLSDQMLTGQGQKHGAVARTVLRDLAGTASSIPGLALVWEDLAPLLEHALH